LKIEAETVTRLIRAACIAALLVIAAASPATASVTIGQLPLGTPTGFADPSGSLDVAQPTVSSGNSYTAPGAGTITSWSHNAAAGAGQMMTLKVFRQVSGSIYTVVGHDGPRSLAGGTVNTFPASIGVQPGDVIGLSFGLAPPAKAWFFAANGDAFLQRNGNLADGQSGSFEPNPDRRLNVTAAFVPTNAFTLAGIELHRKTGTANLKVKVPNPGELVLSGSGVKRVSAVRAVAVSAPGIVRLPIRAKGRKRRTLNETSRVRVKATVTYTPTGGDPSTQSRKLKLKKL
jgi:hypothetical protein